MTRMCLVLGLALLSPVAVVACAHGHEYFRAGGFVPDRNLYGIRYRPGGQHQLMPEGWSLDNFVPPTSGLPHQVKQGAGYRVEVVVDQDGDGDDDWSTETALYDLRMIHGPTGATAWIRSFPLSAELQDRELDVLARDYVERVSGGTYVAVVLGGRAVVAREHHYATRLVEEASIEVDGAPARRARFDVVDVDRHQVDPDAPATRVEIVLVRPRRLWSPPGPTDSVRRAMPALLVLGVAAPEAHFDRVVGDARDLWSRVSLLGGARQRGGEGGAERSSGDEVAHASPPRSQPRSTTPVTTPSPVPTTAADAWTIGDFVVYRVEGTLVSATPRVSTVSVIESGTSVAFGLTETGDGRASYVLSHATGVADPSVEPPTTVYEVQEGARVPLADPARRDSAMAGIVIPAGVAWDAAASAEAPTEIAGVTYTCESRMGALATHGRTLRVDVIVCPAFRWRLAQLALHDAASGELLLGSSVISFGPDR